MKKTIIFLFAGLLLASCSSSIPSGTSKLVKACCSKPDWASDSKTFEQEGNYLYFETTLPDRQSLDFAQEEADATIKNEIATSLSSKIRANFTEAAKGSNITGEILKRLIESAKQVVTKDVSVVGVKITDFYWEKYIKKTDMGMEQYYDVYARGSIPSNIYRTLYKNAINNTLNTNDAELENMRKKLLSNDIGSE